MCYILYLKMLVSEEVLEVGEYLLDDVIVLLDVIFSEVWWIVICQLESWGVFCIILDDWVIS